MGVMLRNDWHGGLGPTAHRDPWVVGYALGGLSLSVVLGLAGVLASAAPHVSAAPSPRIRAVAAPKALPASAAVSSVPVMLHRTVVPQRLAAVQRRIAAKATTGPTVSHPVTADARPAVPPSPMAVALAGTKLGPVWGDYVHAATATGVPLALLVAQGYWESVWNPHQMTVNGPGNVDRGIAQINSYYNAQVTNAEAYNAAWATVWEGRTLLINYEAGGSWANALSLYKGGRVESLLTPQERTGVLIYVNRILATEGAIQGRLQDPPALIRVYSGHPVMLAPLTWEGPSLSKEEGPSSCLASGTS